MFQFSLSPEMFGVSALGVAIFLFVCYTFNGKIKDMEKNRDEYRGVLEKKQTEISSRIDSIERDYMRKESCELKHEPIKDMKTKIDQIYEHLLGNSNK